MSTCDSPYATRSLAPGTVRDTKAVSRAGSMEQADCRTLSATLVRRGTGLNRNRA